jgi:hypothetical protein
MKTLKWTWFLLILLFYSIPRIVYAIKFLISDESEDKEDCNSYINNLAESIKELNKETRML